MLKRKKTFVLLELLIAFALVSVSILPFIRHPYLAMKEEIHLLFEMELERRIESELSDLYVHFCNHPLNFEKNNQTLTIERPSWTLKLDNKVTRNYDTLWKACRLNRKVDKGIDEYSIVKLRVEIYPKGKRGNTLITSGETQVVAQRKL